MIPLISSLFSFFFLFYKLSLEPQETLYSSCRLSASCSNKYTFFLFFPPFVFKVAGVPMFLGADEMPESQHFV